MVVFTKIGILGGKIKAGKFAILKFSLFRYNFTLYFLNVNVCLFQKLKYLPMKTLSGLFVILLLTSCSFTQTKDSAEEKNSLQKGSWAVQFQVGSDFTLSSFENVIVSLKTHFSPKFALRFGIGLNANYHDQTLDYREYYYGYTGTDILTNNNAFKITVLTKLLYYFNPKSTLNVYAGLGPMGTFAHSYNERFYVDGYMEYRELTSWSGGFNGVLGCEIFPFRFLSIFAEYSVSASYEHICNNDIVKEYYFGGTEEYYNTESTNFDFSGNTVRLGLSLYF
jgi:hypothetical protein